MYIGRFHKYKIAAICIAGIQDDHLAYISNTISDSLIKRGYKVLVFNSFTDFYYITTYTKGEASIYHLLNFDLIDVLIVMPETIKNNDTVSKIVNHARESGTPVICIDGEYEGCTNIKYNYREGFENTVRHIVEDHGCTDTFLVAGIKDNSFSEERIDAYKKVLADNNIPFDESKLDYGDFWSIPTKDVMKRYFSTHDKPPQVFICANDSMAITVQREVRSRGFRIPEDVIVTGFDATYQDSTYTVTEITSAIVDPDELADVVAETCAGYMAGTEVPMTKLIRFKLLPAQTCGCTPSDANYVSEKLLKMNDYNTATQSSENRMMQYYADCVGCKTLKDIAAKMSGYVDDISAVCINSDFLTKNAEVMPKEYHSVYTNQMIALCQRDKEVVEGAATYDVRNLIPQLGKALKKYNKIMFVPLHFQSKVIGYYAVVFEYFTGGYRDTRRFTNTTNQILESFMSNYNLQQAYNELDMTYSKDSLTELFNRRGFFISIEKMLENNVGKPLMLISIDMDRLKMINDTYGHTEGDKAIIEVAEALRSVCTKKGACARFGGDEFIIAMPCEDVKHDQSIVIGDIQTHLDNYNRKSGADYEVSISIGVTTEIIKDNFDISELILKTDKLMYEQKRIKKASYEENAEVEKLKAEAHNAIQDYEMRIHKIFSDDASCTYFYMNYMSYKWHLMKSDSTPPCMLSASVNPIRAMWLSGAIYQDDVGVFEQVAKQIKNGFEGRLEKDGANIFIRLTDTGEPIWYNLMLKFVADESGALAEMAGMLRRATSEEIMNMEIVDYYTVTDNPLLVHEHMRNLMLKNSDKNYAIIQFDIKRFKIINETYSEEIGTELLHHIDRQLKAYCNDYQLSARLNADIFTLVTPFETKDDIIGIITEIQDGYKAFRDIKLELVFGVYIVEDLNEPVRIMGDRAAVARLLIKKNAVENIAFYDDKIQKSANSRHFVESNMKQALENKEFNIYLQPKFSISGNVTVGYEALVRWIHPEKGMISPAEFIPLFEENGFILKLDAYVWECACQVLRDWIDRGFSPMPISVNVSRAHLKDDEFIILLDSLLEKYELPKNLLELEITESIEGESTSIMAQKLKEHGYKLLMDDFGSGYSSLNTLKTTKFDIIKIDREFLTELMNDDRGKKIISHTISMSRDVGLGLIAEGVETSEQAYFLSECGCDIAQGFLYAKPMTVQDAEKYLVKSE